jgi:hypothetical protein
VEPDDRFPRRGSEILDAAAEWLIGRPGLSAVSGTNLVDAPASYGDAFGKLSFGICDLPKAFTINRVDSVEVRFEEVQP